MRQLDSALLGPRTKSLFDSLVREKASILAQRCTEHTRLTGYLHRIGNAESDVCDLTFFAPLYTVDTRWNEQRRALTEATDPGLGRLSQMLGGKPESVGNVSEPDDRAWKPNIKIVRAAIAFAIKMGRLAPEG
ncbi:endonuclease/exonuclease/phosphatase [Penicillium sp. IBT 35674x]|nr:endonuclease/exonuclease/phosphatase [Penicillium sp. IBT 35674x]